jgi:hypothetical protein
LSVSSGIIFSFGASVFAISLMRCLRDGAGCGREWGSRSPARSQAHSPTPNPPRCRRHGGATFYNLSERSRRRPQPSRQSTEVTLD